METCTVTPVFYFIVQLLRTFSSNTQTFMKM